MTNIDKKSKFKQELLAYTLLIVGSALFAVGDVMFVNPYLMAPGGTYGLSNVFSSLWGGRIALYAICMDVPLLIIGTWILGPKFGVKTIISTFLIFGFTYLLELVWGYVPVIHDGAVLTTAPESVDGYVVLKEHSIWFKPDYILNTVVSGLIYGVAIGMIFRSGATSGGSDIVSMILHKYTKISLGTLVMIVDGIITVSTFIKSYKTMFIVTEEMEAVRDYILNDLKRGGTCISGTGLYQGNERKMIYVTLDRTDMVKLKGRLHLIDPKAFVNIMDSSEILGMGFKALPKE